MRLREYYIPFATFPFASIEEISRSSAILRILRSQRFFRAIELPGYVIESSRKNKEFPDKFFLFFSFFFKKSVRSRWKFRIYDTFSRKWDLNRFVDNHQAFTINPPLVIDYIPGDPNLSSGSCPVISIRLFFFFFFYDSTRPARSLRVRTWTLIYERRHIENS